MSGRCSGSESVEGDESRRDGKHLRIDPVTGIGLLVITKALDATTTAFALAHVPRIEEGNPFVVAVFDAVGMLPGILGLSAVGILGLALATEFLAGRVEGKGEGYADLIRLIGYGPTSALFFILGVQNAVVILTGVSMFGI